MKRRSPLDPESNRTLIVLFLTYSPELTLGSGFLAQFERVFLLSAFMQSMFEAYVKGQKKAGKSKNRKKCDYDSNDSSNSE